MDLGEVGWGDVDWIGLAKDRDRWRALTPRNLGVEGYCFTIHLDRKMDVSC
jgi:hypothetical protein